MHDTIDVECKDVRITFAHSSRKTATTRRHHHRSMLVRLSISAQKVGIDFLKSVTYFGICLGILRRRVCKLLTNNATRRAMRVGALP